MATLSSHADNALPSLDSLRAMIEHAAHLLPAQGPITAFVHHNTLHAWEDMPFHDAIKQATQTFGCQGYLPEATYRDLHERGRILSDDLWAILLDDLGEQGELLIGRLGTRFHLRLAMLQHLLRMAPSHELHWYLTQTDALRYFRPETPLGLRKQWIEQTRRWVMHNLIRNEDRPHAQADSMSELLRRLSATFDQSQLETWDDANWEAMCLELLWQACLHGVQSAAVSTNPLHPLRHRELLLAATGVDSDRLVHEQLIQFCAAFLDQGVAHWRLPGRELGFYECFLQVYGQAGGPPDRWLRGLADYLRQLRLAQVSPLESIRRSLEKLGIEATEQEAFVKQSLIALRGWAGMIWQMETRGDRVAHPAPPGTLVEFLAVQLILEQFAVEYLAREEAGFLGTLAELRSALNLRYRPSQDSQTESRAYLVFQLAQLLSWRPETLLRLSRCEWQILVDEIEAFPSLERCRIYQLAYERRFNDTLLSAMAAHQRRRKPSPAEPLFQVCCCIDDREESFRRHLEELAPACQTFGFAGFYAVAMYYRGAGDAYYQPLCPVVIKPSHYVREEAGLNFEASERRRAGTRKLLGTASHRFHLGSRSFLGGILTSLSGSLASVPMVTRILFPRTTAQIRKLVGELVRPPLVTQLLLERMVDPPGPENGHTGYSVSEMAGMVERVLRDIGLTSRFARLVIVTGHGSSSLNNPHESAYNCGACAGGRGGPNARAMAWMANDERVRRVLEERGLPIPQTTYFVGAYHNTCDEAVTYYDLDRLPVSHRELFTETRRLVDAARQHNAHERCRRFETARLSQTWEEALRHVETRAEDLSQTRPEYNHATNAATFVGRRERTRGLFLDRRVFLTSYDPLQDDEQHTILSRILQAVFPVCAGISLEYYFSCVDPDGWGCGSKLPHNVTSLLGVMLGAASDLKPGLSRQMVEIHEPLRQLFVIETTPAAMLQILQRDETARRLCMNQWVYLATLDPHSATIHLFRNGRFEKYEPVEAKLPMASSSAEWYRGWRDHLGFASIDAEWDESSSAEAVRSLFDKDRSKELPSNTEHSHSSRRTSR